jgi:hypothetical protein
MEVPMTRRDLAIRSILTLAFLRTVGARDLWAAAVRPIGRHWLADLSDLSRDVKGGAIKQVEWQAKVEELFGKIDLPELLKFIRFDEMTRDLTYRAKGERSLSVRFPKVEGVPEDLPFGRQVFALKKGASVVPHGHDNMATAFLVLRGEFRGRHFERLADEPEHMILAPTLDKTFVPGGAATISDYKDNVHWFEALTDAAFIFNIHVMDVDAKSAKGSRRIYVDPAGQKLEGGKIRARRISPTEAYERYG